MLLDGPVADSQRLCDHLTRLSLQHEIEHLALAGGERLQALGRSAGVEGTRVSQYIAL